MSLSIVAGYTITFVKDGRVKVFTFATTDDAAIEKRLANNFGSIQVIGRTPLDQHALDLLRLRRGDWLEWVPLRGPDNRDI